MKPILTLLQSKGLRSSAQLSLALALGCVGWVEPAKSEFRKIPVTSVESCSIRLAGAEEIPHTCRLYRDANAKLPVWEAALGFEFGRLTYRQWERLVTTYAAWHNRRNLADYDRDRNYNLMDFMPPIMQAWNRHRFHEQEVTTSPSSSRQPQSRSATRLAANCWGTLYEILRLAKQDNPPAPTLFVTDSHPMLQLLRQRSMKIQAHPQTGDIVLVYHQHGNRTYLDHVALAVDQQLYFEKAGAGDDVPYRLIDHQTLEQIWNPDIYTFEYRRPYSQQQWQPPEQVFGQEENPYMVYGHSSTQPRASKDSSPNLPAQMTYFAMKQLPAFVNIKGRFRLSPKAYDPQGLSGDASTREF
ncbi:hypothetical protein [Acaryochloris sp. CCMEE 5410]|uniref:hypothetical protein n=1 Tax=Acaryochloris sp. CCMEE 5410 TaxID=310037 RepID=UPI0002483E7F|nr:hypothetical protein [Acaryochloris sp. CCMEE 5410]